MECNMKVQFCEILDKTLQDLRQKKKNNNVSNK